MELFIDFRNAFDRVDQSILLQKLSRSGVSSRTVNIVKLLYGAYHFTLPNSSPYRINSGVAQRSLISPLLYNLYINDLIESLSVNFSVGRVNAYADDVSVICHGLDEVRKAIANTSSWSESNGAIINHKKVWCPSD